MTKEDLKVRWYRRPAVARYLSTTAMSITRWEKNPSVGFPKGVLVGGVRLYDIDAIDSWLLARAKKQAVAR